jgi:lipopolysaccharide transport system permease protein
MNYLKELWASRELLLNLTQREIKGKYKRTVFGQLWSLVNPLAAMLTYTLVFYFIIRVHPLPGDPSGLNIFALWLLCGLLPFTFVSNGLNNGVTSLVSNAGLIQKVHFSRIVLPLASIGAMAYNWLFEMAVLVIALAIVGSFILPWIPLALVVMLLLTLFVAGLALLLAVANVHFRDTQNFVTVLLPIWMYLTPIIYPIGQVQGLSNKVGPILGTNIRLIDIYQLNPMENFVQVFREILYDNRLPDLNVFLGCVVWTVVSLTVGLLVFRRSDHKLAELL